MPTLPIEHGVHDYSDFDSYAEADTFHRCLVALWAGAARTSGYGICAHGS
ncbi:MAG TPA: hypothetical protein VMK83_04515 [Gaiellaceae bacterium]|nr:hypothetical protein [Gaiellaceae bacterium]